MMMDKMTGLTERLFALVDVLRGQQQMTTMTLAEHFGVSERTIRRDIQRLQALDINVEMVQGRGGGVRLHHGSLLQALRFTDDEALVLALGLKHAQTMNDPYLCKAAETAFQRLEHILTERLRKRLEAVLRDVQTEQKPMSQHELRSGLLLDVANAARQRRRLDIRYKSRSSGFRYRQLDPYGVVQVREQWYVTGYCHLRHNVRVFRLDKLELVSKPSSDPETFTIPKGFNALEFVSSSLAESSFEGSVTCRVWFAADLKDITPHVPSYEATLEVQNEGVLLTIVVHSKWLPRIALSLMEIPALLKILEPAELQAAFAGLSERSLRLSEGECT